MPKSIKNWHRMKFNLVKLRFRCNPKGGYVNKKFGYSTLAEIPHAAYKEKEIKNDLEGEETWQ